MTVMVPPEDVRTVVGAADPNPMVTMVMMAPHHMVVVMMPRHMMMVVITMVMHRAGLSRPCYRKHHTAKH